MPFGRRAARTRRPDDGAAVPRAPPAPAEPLVARRGRRPPPRAGRGADAAPADGRRSAAGAAGRAAGAGGAGVERAARVGRARAQPPDGGARARLGAPGLRRGRRVARDGVAAATRAPHPQEGLHLRAARRRRAVGPRPPLRADAGHDRGDERRLDRARPVATGPPRGPGGERALLARPPQDLRTHRAGVRGDRGRRRGRPVSPRRGRRRRRQVRRRAVDAGHRRGLQPARDGRGPVGVAGHLRRLRAPRRPVPGAGLPRGGLGRPRRGEDRAREAAPGRHQRGFLPCCNWWHGPDAPGRQALQRRQGRGQGGRLAEHGHHVADARRVLRVPRGPRRRRGLRRVEALQVRRVLLRARPPRPRLRRVPRHRLPVRVSSPPALRAMPARRAGLPAAQPVLGRRRRRARRRPRRVQPAPRRDGAARGRHGGLPRPARPRGRAPAAARGARRAAGPAPRRAGPRRRAPRRAPPVPRRLHPQREARVGLVRLLPAEERRGAGVDAVPHDAQALRGRRPPRPVVGPPPRQGRRRRQPPRELQRRRRLPRHRAAAHRDAGLDGARDDPGPFYVQTLGQEPGSRAPAQAPRSRRRAEVDARVSRRAPRPTVSRPPRRRGLQTRL
mmetsp:Transcript_10094/g.34804  ORF Transcript_10094/g.34804 Transcript_10094/m.34804 type:complete len:616 (+) Transcript_10094:1183-3030(+)